MGSSVKAWEGDAGLVFGLAVPSEPRISNEVKAGTPAETAADVD